MRGFDFERTRCCPGHFYKVFFGLLWVMENLLGKIHAIDSHTTQLIPVACHFHLK
ncbi:hypothetical protein AGABI2DRAFT_138057 [Agaricus bisporus var. bisporus H97]|uniref:hypothetical protein n=1 Tax=Agaricus bisporus var. bisporus (strain H97 / ATCC MYA-4626 / FGSC 10389) TaxID=936046 RepID=UPI00029F68F3|nr:hypothetical protein AGABI2DRAFT_138057 [Agaricus bisporus var. bisporus H97]EKV44405.1 hypothetical protein AGABI2DRAFT_138057 [Agaricus bisporus var. bisporus H97]